MSERIKEQINDKNAPHEDYDVKENLDDFQKNKKYTKHTGYSLESFKEFMYWIPRFSSRRREEYIDVITNRMRNILEKIANEKIYTEELNTLESELEIYLDFLLYQRTDEELSFYEELAGNQYVQRAIDDLFEVSMVLKDKLESLKKK